MIGAGHRSARIVITNLSEFAQVPEEVGRGDRNRALASSRSRRSSASASAARDVSRAKVARERKLVVAPGDRGTPRRADRDDVTRRKKSDHFGLVATTRRSPTLRSDHDVVRWILVRRCGPACSRSRCSLRCLRVHAAAFTGRTREPLPCGRFDRASSFHARDMSFSNRLGRFAEMRRSASLYAGRNRIADGRCG